LRIIKKDKPESQFGMNKLHLNTVESETFKLLQGLMEIPELSEFAIVGGTNLSLKFGHRLSVDLDLFTNLPFEKEEVYQAIIKKYPKTIKLDERRQTIWLIINEVKVDILLHEYPYLKPLELIDGVRFLSLEDVIPLKLEAMATRGVKKDFWDLAELLNHFSLEQMFYFYSKKYTNSDFGHILISMTYFVDAEIQIDDPIDLKGISWENVKSKIRFEAESFIRNNL
jgi:hypothetical protein